MQLRQLIPQEFCLKCDVCCKFSQPESVWAPLFTKTEIEYLVDHDIIPPVVFTSHPSYGMDLEKQKQLRINLIGHEDYFICPCLSPSDHSCKIYDYRPFECQLYPFLLVKNKGKFYLAKDLKCPFFKKGRPEEIKDHIEYLCKEIQKKGMLSFLRGNPELFTEYPVEDLELLFPINL